ncbi:MAG TPA: hypothetical protein VK960_07585 [Acidimicrobiia bacterium]|nr:hypothetical protein [Acidimicrobiia bacterium]
MAARSPASRRRSTTFVMAVLLAVVLLLLVHGVVMGLHHVPDAGCATCLVAIAAALVGSVICALLASPVPPVSSVARDAVGEIDRGAMASRHPPRVGPVLRL